MYECKDWNLSSIYNRTIRHLICVDERRVRVPSCIATFYHRRKGKKGSSIPRSFTRLPRTLNVDCDLKTDPPMLVQASETGRMIGSDTVPRSVLIWSKYRPHKYHASHRPAFLGSKHGLRYS